MGPVPAGAGTRRFGKYTLVAKLAQGGMAEIFLARLGGVAGFEKLVCIKRILPELAQDTQFVQMFLDEARVVARISHPNVCQVFELGEIEGQYYIAMEYLEGVPLSAFRRPENYSIAPDPQLVVGVLVQACEGLHHAHQLKGPGGGVVGLVHRDVSPANLFVTKDGVVKVLDFGIAKIQDASSKTSTGAVKGTYAYMPPEQLRGEKLDRRVDVFALGAVTWEILARRHLFRRETDYLTFQAVVHDPIPDVCTFRPDVSPELSAVVTKALARHPEQRYDSARAFGDGLRMAIANLGGPLSPSAIGEEVMRAFARRVEEQHAMLEAARAGGAFDLDDLVDSFGERETSSPSVVGQRRSTLHEVPPGVPSVMMEVVAPASGRISGPIDATTPARRSSQMDIAAPMRRSSQMDATGPVRRSSQQDVVYAPRLPTAPSSSTWWIPVVALIVVAGAGAMFYIWVNRAPPAQVAAAQPPPAPSAAPVVVMHSVDAAVVEQTPPVDAAVAAEVPAATEPEVVPAAPPKEWKRIPKAPDRTVKAERPVKTAPEHPAKATPDHVVKATPEPSGPPGLVTIDSSPMYAVIFIDGRRYGETPIADVKVSPGTHQVRAVSASGATKNFTIEIESGQSTVRKVEW